jgi:hypothetical protein
MHPLRNEFGSIAAIAAILRQSPKEEFSWRDPGMERNLEP